MLGGHFTSHEQLFGPIQAQGVAYAAGRLVGARATVLGIPFLPPSGNEFLQTPLTDLSSYFCSPLPTDRRHEVVPHSEGRGRASFNQFIQDTQHSAPHPRILFEPERLPVYELAE